MPALWPELRAAIAQAEAATRDLKEIGAAHGAGHLDFTLDGRIVGDIGELIASRYFDIDLHTKQRGCHDGTCRIDGREAGIQIKCRVKSWVIDFTSEPELLLVIRIAEDWNSWEVVYNGPGSIVTAGTNLTIDTKRRLVTPEGTRTGIRLWLEDFERASRTLPTTASRISERNPQP